MSHVISHLTLFPVIFTIPPSTAFPKLSKHKDETLPTSWTCYLPPYFSVTFSESLSLRTWQLFRFSSRVAPKFFSFLLRCSLWHWPVCVHQAPNRKFSDQCTFQRWIFCSFHTDISIQWKTPPQVGWVILIAKLCHSIIFQRQIAVYSHLVCWLTLNTMNFASTNPSIKVRNLTFYIFLESLWCRQRLGTCWKWQRHTQRKIQKKTFKKQVFMYVWRQKSSHWQIGIYLRLQVDNDKDMCYICEVPARGLFNFWDKNNNVFLLILCFEMRTRICFKILYWY